MEDVLFIALLIGIAIHFILGYLLGSIPFGLIFTRIAGLGDIRAIGSKNIGATNVLRTGRKDLAIATLLADMLKGTAAVLLAYYFADSPAISILDRTIAGTVTGLGAFIGHVFPVWLRFKGGKGVATYIGVLLGTYWPGALIFGAIWLATALATRYSSLSAIIASIVTPIILFLFVGQLWGIAFAMMSAILILKHRENIARLRSGTETKIGNKTATAKS